MAEAIRYAAGRKAWGFCGRCGLRALLHDLVFDGYFPNMRVHPACRDDRHPQELLTPLKDAQALWRPSPEPGGPTEPELEVDAGTLTWTRSTVEDELLKGYRIYRGLGTADVAELVLIDTVLVEYDEFAGEVTHPLTYEDEDAPELEVDESVTYRVDAFDMLNRVGSSNLAEYTQAEQIGILWIDESEPTITVTSDLVATASYALPDGTDNRLIVAACLVYGDTVGAADLGSITMSYGGVAMAMLERATNQLGDTLDIGSVGNLFKIVIGVLSVNGQSFANSNLVVSDTSFYTGPNRKHFTLFTFDNVNPADADLSYGSVTFANVVALGVSLPFGADVVAGEMLFSFGFTTEYNGSENQLVFTSSSGDPAGVTQIPATLAGSNFIAVDINANERFLCARAGFLIASQDGSGTWNRSSDVSSSGDETFGAVAFRVRPSA